MENSLRSIFSFISVVSALAFLGLIALLHFLPNKYNPIKNTVSDYAIALSGGQHAFVAVAMPLAGAVSSLSLAAAMAANVGIAPTQTVLALILSSVGRFFLIFFPTDVPGQPATRIGRIHLAFAITAFAGIAVAACNFNLTARDEVLGQLAAVTAGLLLLGFFLPRLKKIFGLLERIALFSSVIWLVAAGVELLFKG